MAEALSSSSAFSGRPVSSRFSIRRKGQVHLAGRVGAVVIDIYPLPDDGTLVDASTRLGFAVENLTEVVQTLQRIGTNIVTPPRETAWGLQAIVTAGRRLMTSLPSFSITLSQNAP